MDGCIHGLQIDYCSPCTPPPMGINKTVYVTKGGMAFHNDSECEALKLGQAEAEYKGLENHPINPTGWANAFNERKPCRTCCQDYKPNK